MLLEGWDLLRKLITEADDSTLSPLNRVALVNALYTKCSQFEEATNLSGGIEVEVLKEGSSTVVSGDILKLHVNLKNRNNEINKNITLTKMYLYSLGEMGFGLGFTLLPETTMYQEYGPIARRNGKSGNEKVFDEYGFQYSKVSGEIILSEEVTQSLSTRPYWHRDDPERENLFKIDKRPDGCQICGPVFDTKSLPPYMWSGTIEYKVNFNSKTEKGKIHFVVEANDAKRTPLAIVPAYSLLMEHGSEVIPRGQAKPFAANVNVHKVSDGPSDSKVTLTLPKGWKVEPAVASVHFDAAGEKKVHFDVTPLASTEQVTEIRAELTDNKGKKYSEGFSVVTRDDLSTFYYYQPSVQKVHVVDVALPAKLKLGYIMGAGDDIFSALQQLGLDATLITPEELASGDLSKYGTIVLGIRAYDTRDDVRKNNPRLLKYVEDGGTLVVQNNFSVNDFNNGKYTPFPMTLSNQRVSVEEAPVDVLAPQDPIFQYPNAITAKDFDGWIQERGVNFMTQWDDHFQPLLASGDPGEAKLKGGLLRARYGKGTYIYTGYAFFRQIPAGVSGAIRLYVNLLSAGHGN